jgi:hypothetical protein
VRPLPGNLVKPLERYQPTIATNGAGAMFLKPGELL